jgi:hypothetical protein
MIRTQRLGVTFSVFALLALTGIALVPRTGRPQDRPTRVAGPTAEQLLALEQLAQTRRELVQLQSESRRAQIELNVLLAKLAKVSELEVSEAALHEFIAKDPLAQKLQARLSQLEESADLIQTKSSRGADDPSVRRFQADIQATQEALRARREKLRPALRQETRARAQAELLARIEPLHERIDQQKALENLLEKDVKRLSEQTRSLTVAELSSEATQRLARLEDEVRQLRVAVEQLRDLLLKKGR